MSYILDALRKADAERERKRGAVPSLQSQQHTLVPEDDAPPRSRLLPVMVAMLAVVVIALLAWMLFGDRTPAAPARTLGDEMAAAKPQAMPAPPQPMTLTQMAAAPPPAATSPPPVAVPALTTTATTSPPRTTPARPAQEPTDTTRSSRRVATAAPQPAPLAKAAAMTTAPATAAEGRIVPQAELPDSVRRELPTLAFAGASYSGDAASRMVIINGQVFHEGDTIAHGLVLQQIRLKSAVLGYRGYRYEVTY